VVAREGSRLEEEGPVGAADEGAEGVSFLDAGLLLKALVVRGPGGRGVFEFESELRDDCPFDFAGVKAVGESVGRDVRSPSVVVSRGEGLLAEILRLTSFPLASRSSFGGRGLNTLEDGLGS
jgi:hypothetical protein